jgi:hypothetical protein
MVLLQTIMAGVVLDRHWDNVTKVLARSLTYRPGHHPTARPRQARLPKSKRSPTSACNWLKSAAAATAGAALLAG